MSETQYCRNCRAENSSACEFCSECGFTLDQVAKIDLSESIAAVGSILPPVDAPSDKEEHVELTVITPYGQEAVTETKADSSINRVDQMTELLKRQAENERELKEIEDVLNQISAFEPQLDAWTPTSGRSFQKIVTDRMNSEMQEVRGYLDRYNAALNALIYPNAGVMHDLRKRFHRTLIGSFSTITAIAVFLHYLPRLVKHIKGHPLLVRLLNDISPSPLKLALYSFGTFFIIYVVALTRYYRGWSVFQARLNQRLWAMSDIATGAGQVRSEELRLKALFPQVKEWLEIIGFSLVRPWRVNPAWYSEPEETIVRENLPYSMRVARAEGSDSASMLALQRSTAEQFLSRGWRSKALEIQMKVFREAMGMSEDRLSPDELDKDIAYAPNGPRAIVLKLNNDPVILEKVAAAQLELLTEEIQRAVFQKNRPQVREVRPGQVNALSTGLADPMDSKVYDWDEFVSTSVTISGRPTVPFSPKSLTDEGQGKGRHTQVSTFYVLPNRLAGVVDPNSESTIRSFDEQVNSAMDFVLRADLAGPLDNSDLRILEESESEKSKRQAHNEEKLKKRARELTEDREEL